ncbi:kinase-like protein [Rickenella mellea]|uniref:Kinase-like protein n=1 Tax=Rickenella mellea TaxID=50990 RepID=A0A4Y7Q5D0_9AGAM|nr:kinase-like protein [Rickenella mellea]
MKRDSVQVLVDHDEIHQFIIDMVDHWKAVEQYPTIQSQRWSDITIQSFEHDQDELRSFTERIIRSLELREAIYSLPPASIRRFLGVLQCMLSVNCTRERVFERFIKKIIAKTGLLPQNLFVKGLSKIGDNPLVGGGFADVWKGEFHGELVALKVLRVFEHGQTDYDALQRSFCMETMLWQKLHHANVLPFYGICEDMFRPKLAMVSPWMENGDMVKYLKHNIHVDRRHLSLGVAKGLDYLHSLRPAVVHGDLRAANVIIDGAGQPLIADFGLTKVIDSQASVSFENSTSFGGRGNVRWHAPEVLHASRFNLQRSGVTKETDVYAYACVCLEIFTGQVPFADLVDGAVIMAVAVNDQRPPRPSEPATSLGLDDHMWELIEDCWKTQPGDRMPMDEVVTCISEMNATHTPPKRFSMAQEHGGVLTQNHSDIMNSPDWLNLLTRGVRRLDSNPVAGVGHADIWRGELRGELVALKVMRIFGGMTHDIISAVKEEAMVMQRLVHVNVLPFYGICDDEFRPHFSLVFPWMENGPVLSFLERNSDTNRLSLVRGIASGLRYIHGLTPALIHGDLRASNVLVDANLQPRISNFGFSMVYDSLSSVSAHLHDTLRPEETHVGRSVRWLAPEILSGQQRRSNTKTDVYAFGCVCIEFFTGKPPFHGLREYEVLMAVQKYERPSRPTDDAAANSLDDTIWRIMQSCWARNPRDRPTADTLVEYVKMHQNLLRI